VLLGSATPEVLNETVGNADSELVKWLNEGWALERDAVYIGELKDTILQAEAGEGRLPTIKLSEDYLRHVRKVSDKRFVASGVRIAALLQ